MSGATFCFNVSVAHVLLLYLKTLGVIERLFCRLVSPDDDWEDMHTL